MHKSWEDILEDLSLKRLDIAEALIVLNDNKHLRDGFAVKVLEERLSSLNYEIKAFDARLRDR